MDIVRRFLDGKYNIAYSELLENFQTGDFAVGEKGKTRIILGKENVTIIYGNSAEETDYDSFIASIRNYNELCKLLRQKEFVKKPSKMGVDIYGNNGDSVIVGRKVIFGKTKIKLTYDEAIDVLRSY
jgi:hypothetical protein